jgi:hypothetical protein
MNAAYERLVQHLNERDVRYRANGDAGIVSTSIKGDVGTYRFMALVGKSGDLFQVYGQSPVSVPVGARPAIAEAIARANFSLRIGQFELDCDDGELSFYIAHILHGDLLEDEVIERMFVTSISMLNRYLPAFLSVIYGNELPKDAIQHVETPDHTADDEDVA